MSRQRGRPLAGKTRNFIVNNPDEKVQLSELINGIRQYQDEEYKTMQAEFDRVEQLLASEPSPKESNNLWKPSSFPTDRSQLQHNLSANQAQEYGNVGVMKNHCRYVRWILLFFVMLFFGVMTKLYIGRITNDVVSIVEYVRSKIKN